MPLLAEHIEHEWQELGIDSYARIAGQNYGVVPLAFKRDENAAARGRKFDRVRQDVPEDLLESAGVPIDIKQLSPADEIQPDGFLFRVAQNRFEGGSLFKRLDDPDSEVAATEFTRADRQRYRDKVKLCLDVFARMLAEAGVTEVAGSGSSPPPERSEPASTKTG